MKRCNSLDILFNILSPIACGSMLYAFSGNLFFSPALINYLPDGLWAYAFLSAILIIWKRDINVTWAVVVFGVAILYETLQYYYLLPGTGDVYDVVVYLIAFIIALRLNQYFKTTYQTIAGK